MSNETEWVAVKRDDLLRWAEDYARDNDPGDDTDIVTPFDGYLLQTPSVPVGMEGLRRMVEKLAAHVRPTCRELWEEAQTALAQQPAAVDEGCMFSPVFEHLANAYDVASRSGDAAAMHCHAEAIEALREAVGAVQAEVRNALRELDRVTATEEQADDLGCAENALNRALAALTGPQGGAE